MRNKFIVWIFILFFSSYGFSSDTIKIMGEDLPPFSYLNEDREVVGIATELVRKLAQEVGQSDGSVVSRFGQRAIERYVAFANVPPTYAVHGIC